MLTAAGQWFTADFRCSLLNDAVPEVQVSVSTSLQSSDQILGLGVSFDTLSFGLVLVTPKLSYATERQITSGTETCFRGP